MLCQNIKHTDAYFATFFRGCAVIQNPCISACQTLCVPLLFSSSWSCADNSRVKMWSFHTCRGSGLLLRWLSLPIVQKYVTLCYCIRNTEPIAPLTAPKRQRLLVLFIICHSHYFVYLVHWNIAEVLFHTKAFWCVSPTACNCNTLHLCLPFFIWKCHLFCCVCHKWCLSVYFQMKDLKIQKTVENFHSFVHTLLTEPAERELFFKVRAFFRLSCRRILNLVILLSFDFGRAIKTMNSFHSSVWQEEFQVEYGPKFDQELEKLLWEFLLRLDRLLPVPNLAQVL